MLYNFSTVLAGNSEVILEEFLDKYTVHVDAEKEDGVSLALLSNHYKNILDMLGRDFEEEDILELFEKLAYYETALKMPYIIIMNELFCLKHILLTKTASIPDNHLYIPQILTLFGKISNRVAKIYLDGYADMILSLNNLRKISISDLAEKNTIRHYENHLGWLTNLTQCVKNRDLDNFPQMEAKDCNFGKWLHIDGKNVIHNNSKFNTIDNIHKSLHQFAQKIFMYIKTDEYHILITYLEKCELLSLSLGTELALVDNILMNQQVTKDPLTGALNRNGLKNIFESQYELSFATNNHFVLAICDLDHFKEVNDTYGHVVGDKVLVNFVTIVQRNIRNSDIVIRYGGEEFVIILPAINKEKGCEVLEKIRSDFQDFKLQVNNDFISATVSIGMMEIKPEYHYKKSFLNEYIMLVDQKLYLAKHNGRNRVEAC